MLRQCTLALVVVMLLFRTLPVYGMDEAAVKAGLAAIEGEKDPQKAIRALLRLRDSAYQSPEVSQMSYARILRKLGTLYYVAKDPLAALPWYRQYVHLVRQYGKTKEEKEQLAGGYYWLSLLYGALNMVTEQLKAMDSCEKVADELGIVNRSNLQAVYARVEYYFNIGDYYRSIDYALKCEALAKQYAKTCPPAEVINAEKYTFSSLLWRVHAFLQLKDFSSARRLLTDRLEACRKAGLTNYLGTFYEQLAELELQADHAASALSYFNEALGYSRAAKQYFYCKQTLNAIANRIWFEHLHQPSQALKIYKEALLYVNKDTTLRVREADRLESLNIYGNMANASVAMGDFAQAFTLFEKAFGQLQRGADEQYILSLPDNALSQVSKIHYVVALVIDKGDAWFKKYEHTKNSADLSEAIRLYRVAEKLLDRIRELQSDLQSKLFWRSDSRRLYEQAIAACYAQHNAEDAFYFFEKSRAVLLQDQWNEQRWFTEKQLLQQAAIRKRIRQLEVEASGLQPASPQFAALQNQRMTQQQQLDSLYRMIRAKNPLVDLNAALPYGLQQLQQHLAGTGQVMLSLFSGAQSVFVLAIDPEHVVLKQIDREQFQSLATRYLDYCSGREAVNRDYNGFVQTAHGLYRLLFDDVKMASRRVLFSPDGTFFPLDALVVEERSRPVYFFEQYATTYSYSAQFLLGSYHMQQPAAKAEFLGIAPVTTPSFPQLPSLTGSDRSLKTISGYFSEARDLAADQASRQNFLERFHQYAMIQLYTHGEANSAAGEPRIYFNDAPLYLSDLVLDKPVATRLVFLSACETAAGRVYQGEGVFNFSRGFAALGIPASVSMLWQVDNQATYRITELFYRFLSDGLPKDLALQKARMEWFRHASAEQQFPYYWAPAVLMGNPEPLVERKSTLPSLAIMLLLALLLFAVMRHTMKQPTKQPHFSNRPRPAIPGTS